jgi:hypothetical protein
MGKRKDWKPKCEMGRKKADTLREDPNPNKDALSTYPDAFDSECLDTLQEMR